MSSGLINTNFCDSDIWGTFTYETKKLPFLNTPLEKVADGTYEGKTYTSFLHLQVEVTVKNHTLTDIQLIENKGSKGHLLDKMVQKMLEQNKVVVQPESKDKLASLVLISCVDSAINKGLENTEGTDPKIPE